MQKEQSINKMGVVPIPKLMLSMGVPMILLMVLQAFYNIVDSYFVSSIAGTAEIPNLGELAVHALTLAFPIQLPMALLLTRVEHADKIVWWVFPISEGIAFCVALFMMRKVKKINNLS